MENLENEETLEFDDVLTDDVLADLYESITHRIYWLDKEITSDTMDLMRYIIKWNREDKDIPVEKRVPIKLIVNCLGGSLEIS